MTNQSHRHSQSSQGSSQDTSWTHNMAVHATYVPIIEPVSSGGFSSLNYWEEFHKRYQQHHSFSGKLKRFFNHQVVECLVTFASVLLNIYGILKSIFYKYPINSIIKSCDNIRRGRKTTRSIIRLCSALGGIVLFLFVGTVFLPSIGVAIAAFTSFTIPFLPASLIPYIGLILGGSFAGVFISKQVMRVYSWFVYGHTNPGKFHVKKEYLLTFFDDEQLCDELAQAFERHIRHELNTCRFLGIVSPYRREKYAFYKNLMVKLKEGNGDYIGTYLKKSLINLSRLFACRQHW